MIEDTKTSSQAMFNSFYIATNIIKHLVFHRPEDYGQ